MIAQFPGYEVVPERARAGLIIVHGIAEYAGRYRHVAEALAAKGIACFAYDQRGRHCWRIPGVRTQRRGFCRLRERPGIDRQVRAGAGHEIPALPLFVWGHSMGSIIVTLAAIHGLRWARGVITSGCALDALPNLEGAAGYAMRLASAIAPRLRISLRIDATELTHVDDLQRQHMNDPLVPHSASLRLLYGFALACRNCRANASKITLPWLAVHGEEDKVCPLSGSRALIDAIASHDKRLVTYPGLLHEVHNEDERARTALFDLMSRWMLARC